MKNVFAKKLGWQFIWLHFFYKNPVNYINYGSNYLCNRNCPQIRINFKREKETGKFALFNIL